MLELLPWSRKLDPPRGWKFYGAGFLHSHWFPVVENSTRSWCFASFRSEDHRRCVSKWSNNGEESWAESRLERFSTLWPRNLGSLCVALSLSQQACLSCSKLNVGSSWNFDGIVLIRKHFRVLFGMDRVKYVCWNVEYLCHIVGLITNYPQYN